MTNSDKFPRWQAMALIAALSLIWGYNWVMMKVAVTYAPPFAFAALRFLGGAVVLMASAQDRELLGPETGINDLLYRLFHEDGVRVFTGHDLKAQCRCSRGKVENVLNSLGPDELNELAVDGALVVTCEFCNSEYRFALGDVTN